MIDDGLPVPDCLELRRYFEDRLSGNLLAGLGDALRPALAREFKRRKNKLAQSRKDH